AAVVAGCGVWRLRAVDRSHGLWRSCPCPRVFRLERCLCRRAGDDAAVATHGGRALGGRLRLFYVITRNSTSAGIVENSDIRTRYGGADAANLWTRTGAGLARTHLSAECGGGD